MEPSPSVYGPIVLIILFLFNALLPQGPLIALRPCHYIINLIPEGNSYQLSFVDRHGGLFYVFNILLDRAHIHMMVRFLVFQLHTKTKEKQNI